MKKIFIGFSIVAGSFLLFSFGGNQFEIQKNIQLFTDIYKLLNANYVDELNSDELIKDGINGMLSSLDPYNAYYPEENVDAYKMQISGEYGGVGSTIRVKDDYVIIAEPYENSPAQKAGLKAGDKISKIDGVSYKGKTTDDVSNTLRGKPNTQIEVELIDGITNETRKVTIKREQIKLKSVPHFGMLPNKTGYIYLMGFRTDCGEEVKEAFINLKNDGAERVILDLRDNPGGLLNEAVNVANVFLPKGVEIVSTKGKKDDFRSSEKTRYQPVDTEMPLVVLVSRNSASASEIVSGAIQDFDRGVVVGSSTFGKGLVQTTRELPFNSRLKMTTAKYYLPSGRCIQAVDYSGRYKDGGAEKISDSLRTEFFTKNKRPVYDAGGIDPDVEVEPEAFKTILVSLIQQDHIFDFVSKFVSENPTIPAIEDFKITDAIYNDFTQFLSKREHDYDTQSEKIAEDLERKAEKEEFSDALQAKVFELNRKIRADKSDDIQVFKEEISFYIRQEIATRYYFQSGAIAASLTGDPAIEKATALLNNTNEYKQILRN